jgi:hypothetical protein
MSHFVVVLICFSLTILSSCEKPPSEDDLNTGGGGSGGGSGGSGGSGNGCSTSGIPKTGSFGVKVYNPTGACANTTSGYNGWIKAYYYCPAQYPSTCGYVSGNIATPSGFGQTDAGGLYWYSLYGDNPQSICRGTMYRIEWEFTPNKSSYPTSCIISGSSIIDFQGQSKQVVIRWP